MKRPILVLDIETVPDPDLPPPPKKKGSKKGDDFPPIPCHRIGAIGAALLDAYGRLRRLWIVGGAAELDMLTALVAWLNTQLVQRSSRVLAGWNTRGFDMPVIAAHALRHGIAFPCYYEPRGRRYHYGEGISTSWICSRLTGPRKTFPLDLAARTVGMLDKVGRSGADVARLVSEGRIEEVRAYCARDVAQTVAVLLRTMLLRGDPARDAYETAARALIDAIDRDPRLAPMVPQIDCKRILLASPQSERKAA